MAKKRKAKITLSKRDNKIATLPVSSANGLPEYRHFVDSLHNKIRLFFEEPQNRDEVNDTRHPKKSYYRAGKFSRTKDGFMIVRDGSALVGEEIAKTFAQLVTEKLLKKDLSGKTIGKIHTVLDSYFKFISTLDSPPTSPYDLSVTHTSHWLEQFSSDKAKTYKSQLKVLLDLHPILSKRNLTAVALKPKATPIQNLDEVDFDKLKEESDYSDRELIQILAYIFYYIEKAEEHLNELEEISISDLGNDYVSLDNVSIKNPTIKGLLESGHEGHIKLLKHMYIYNRNELNGIRKNDKYSDANYFTMKLSKLTKRMYRGKHNYFDDFMEFLHSQAWSIHNKVKESNKIPYNAVLTLQSDHHEVAILLYTLITTGLNLETVLDWKTRPNNIPWYKNFDVELGVNEETAPRDKSIVMVGKKEKGSGGAKPISTPIKVNSPLYHYLMLIEKNRNPDREKFFNINDIHRHLKAFAKHFGIVADDGTLLESIETRRIRKVFAGHKLISLLKDVKSADELVAKLKDALNHNQFDTTLFSYILKSGTGNLVLNSAIVALTSDLLEKAMTFKGKIKEDQERADDTHKVFLCDCTDPSNPSHDLPVADKCKKYDMCLGCERSEVYSEHLPAICYRIMQYESKRSKDQEVFKVTLEDRLHIALDTIEKFKIRHTNGMELVEAAYVKASNAMENNTPLLPPILQTGDI